MSLAVYALSGGDEQKVKDTSVAYSLSGKGAEDAAEDAAKTAAEAQQNALNYLKSVEEVPQKYRSLATEEMAFMYGFGTPEEQANAQERYEGSMAYQNVMGGREAGEESILRHSSATGDLRGGSSKAALAKYNQDLYSQSFNQYMGGIGGLAQLPTNPEAIASGTSKIGETLASGQIAGAQAQQAGMGNIVSLAGTAAKIFYSDIRLKDNVRHIGNNNGHNWYQWDWNEEAKKLGLNGESEGYMAHEVYKTNPEAITDNNGYLMVNTEMLEN